MGKKNTRQQHGKAVIRRMPEDTHRDSENKEEQIIETRDKPQHLATQRLLSCLQYPDATKSSTKDLSLPPRTLKGVGSSLWRM